MQKFPVLSISLFSLLVFLFACVKEPIFDNPNPQTFSAQHGIFVLNEGTWGKNNSTISFYNPDNGYEVQQSVFSNVNGTNLGDVGNSVYLQQDTLFIVMNSSRIIYKVQMPEMKLIGELHFPETASLRFMEIISETKAYVSSFHTSKLFVMNPASMQITGEIPIENHAEQFYTSGNKTYVSIGNYTDFNNKLAIINNSSDQVEQYISLAVENPGALLSFGNQLIIASKGDYFATNKQSSFTFFNLSAQKIDTTIFMQGNTYDEMVIKEQSLYFLSDFGISGMNLLDFSIQNSYKPKSFFQMNETYQLLYSIFYFEQKDQWIIGVSDSRGDGLIQVYDGNFSHKLFEKPAGEFPGTIFYF